MPTESAMIHALRARLLRRAPADLPVAATATRGEPLRRVLRETGENEREPLIRAWRAALDALHRGGFGTDGALAASRWLGEEGVGFDPDRIWPLGTMAHAARPVAAWLDHMEIARWLVEAGQTTAAEWFDGGEPWPGAGDVEAVQERARIVAVVGPPDETVAIGAAQRWPILRGADLEAAGRTDEAGHDEGVEAGRPARAELFRTLATQMSATIAVHDQASARRTPVVFDATVMLKTAGARPHLDADERRFFGMAATRADGERADGGTGAAEQVWRSLEDTDFIADPVARQRARAQLLPRVPQNAVESGSGRRRAIDAAVDLARSAGDRVTLVNLLLRRAEATVGDDADKAVADATEARRLATAMRDAELVMRTAAWETILGLLESTRPRASATLLPARESLQHHMYLPIETLALALLATELAALREMRSVAKARLLTLGRLSGAPMAVVAAIETLVMQAIAGGDDLGAEALLQRATQMPDRLTRGAAEAFAALLAARRGARVTATERVLRLSEHGALPARVAAVAAMAARNAMLEALGGGFDAQVSGDDTPVRVLTGAAPGPDAPDGWWTLYTEHLLTRREADIRRQLGAVMDRIGRWSASDDTDDAWPAPVGLLAAVGSLLASIGDGRGKQPLLRALLAGRVRTLPEHLELRILSALGLLLPADSDEGRAVRDRADLLTSQRPPPSLDSREMGPPLTPQAAQERMLDVLRDMVATASDSLTRVLSNTPVSNATPLFLEVLESLLGPLISNHVHGQALVGAVQDLDFDLHEDVDGSIIVTPIANRSNDLLAIPPLRFAGPGRLPLPIASELLTTMRPLIARPSASVNAAGSHGNARASSHRSDRRSPGPEGDWRVDPLALDAALRQRRVAFFGDVQRAFAAHEVTAMTVRGALREALTRHQGLYRAVAEAWHVGTYRRWMDFLRRNGCLEDFRPFRRRAATP